MLKRNLFFLFTITTFATASLILDTFNYNPFEANTGIFINFYVSCFLSLGGIFSFCAYYTRIVLLKSKLIYASFWPSVRQGFFLSTAATSLLFLQSLRVLDWWVGGSISIVIILLELFFQTKKPASDTDSITK